MSATIEASSADASANTLISSFVLTGHGPDLDITAAIEGTPELNRTIDGGSSFDLQLADFRYDLANHEKFLHRFYADMGGLGYEGVAVKSDPNLLTITFEDAISAACKRTGLPARKVDKGTMTRQQIAKVMLADVQPPIELVVENDGRGVVNEDVERGTDTSPWDVLGSLASGAGWRRFSDGKRILMGSDAWLITRTTPAVFRPYTGPVHGVSTDVDTGKPASQIDFEVDALSWTLPPGRGFRMDGIGLASGDWLITDVKRGLYSLRASVTGQRRTVPIAEAPPETDATAADAGETGNVPVTTSKAPSTTSSSSSTGMNRIADIAVSIASRGLPYVWGGKNAAKQGGYDCSGFVAAVTAQYGRQLSGGSKAQHATCRAQGRIISVQEALRTRGAILFRMNTEPSHIAISLGDGRTAEARGSKYGVKVFAGAAGRSWTAGARWE